MADRLIRRLSPEEAKAFEEKYRRQLAEARASRGMVRRPRFEIELGDGGTIHVGSVEVDADVDQFR